MQNLDQNPLNAGEADFENMTRGWVGETNWIK